LIAVFLAGYLFDFLAESMINYFYPHQLIAILKLIYV